jgi:hypothetical protein
MERERGSSDLPCNAEYAGTVWERFDLNNSYAARMPIGIHTDDTSPAWSIIHNMEVLNAYQS